MGANVRPFLNITRWRHLVREAPQTDAWSANTDSSQIPPQEGCRHPSWTSKTKTKSLKNRWHGRSQKVVSLTWRWQAGYFVKVFCSRVPGEEKEDPKAIVF